MRQHVSAAVVLHHRDYGEADRIVSLFTRDHGRLGGFARNARKSRKRFGAALEPFASIRVTWTQRPRAELVGLEGAELVRLRDGLRRRLEAFALAGYAVELVELLLEEGQPLPELFDLLEALLDDLDAGGEVRVARLLFELRLVHLLGWGPHLGHCSACYGSLGEGAAGFHLPAGGALCRACAPPGAMVVAAGTLGSLARCQRAPLTTFAGIRLGATTLEEGGRLLQQVLASHWSRPPRSLDFLRQMVVCEP